jgi:hypothetical protein
LELHLLPIEEVSSLGRDFDPVLTYLKRARDLLTDGGALVDTFLHSGQRSYTVWEYLDLVSSAGLTFQGWFHKTPYYPNDLVMQANGFTSMLDRLPDAELWSVMSACKHLTPPISSSPDDPNAEKRITRSISRLLDHRTSFPWRVRRACCPATKSSRPEPN